MDLGSVFAVAARRFFETRQDDVQPSTAVEHIDVMEFEEAPSPVDPEVRAYVYSLVSAVR